jgi:hypothetical protein
VPGLLIGPRQVRAAQLLPAAPSRGSQLPSSRHKLYYRLEAEQGKEFWRRLFGLIFGMKAEYLQSVPLVTRLSPAMGFRCAGREKDEPRLRWYSRKRLPTKPSLENRHIVSSNQFVVVS